MNVERYHQSLKLKSFDANQIERTQWLVAPQVHGGLGHNGYHRRVDFSDWDVPKIFMRQHTLVIEKHDSIRIFIS